ncbi:MAG: endopeptidase La [Chitinophagales bacterium]|nr:endopeptidase La [Bacteroidota bacterium]
MKDSPYILSGEESDFFPLVSINEEDMELNGESALPQEVSIVVFKNTVLFPGVVMPLHVRQRKNLKILRKACNEHRMVGILASRSGETDSPDLKDLFEVGTLVRVMKVLDLPDNETAIVVQARNRFKIDTIWEEGNEMKAKITHLPDEDDGNKVEMKAITIMLRDLARRVVELSPNIPNEAVVALNNIEGVVPLMHMISSNLNVDIAEKQALLEMNSLKERGEKILEHLYAEIQLLEIKSKIQHKVHSEIDKQQRDYFLQQQIKTLQDELHNDGGENEFETLKAKASRGHIPLQVKNIFDKEFKKLQRMNPNVADYTVTLNYLELLVDLPWDTYTKDDLNLQKAADILDKDHFGLEKVKERILEYLAVLKLKGDLKSPILCFVGPPGVGKTSLGKSIASALGRNYIRMSLGGLHDESEIRGHRKTYIGAMPGRIIQSINKAGSSNPVFILDEIDKLGKDFRGDPSSALLEVLDPEQNHTFYDNYLETEYDLSKVMFIATANSLSSIQPALLDRMEIIQISGYSVEEKINIAQKHLIPQQRSEHGLKAIQVKLQRKALQTIITDYTRESGVRNLSRKIASLMRYRAKEVAMETDYKPLMDTQKVVEILGEAQRYEPQYYSDDNPPGVAVGLAWTSTGGDILFIETNKSKGNGKLQLTGNLGDVMKESATTALSFLKANATHLGIEPVVFEQNDFHLHVPEGAIPKDGPSAGITIFSALASLILERNIKPYLAMTGEITLRGKVLPVGGIKEKLLAAKRAGIKEIVLCEANRKNVEEIKSEYLANVQIHYIHSMEDVLKIALVP